MNSTTAADRQGVAPVERPADAVAGVALSLQQRWTAALAPSADGVVLRVTHPERTGVLEVTIVLTEQGPVLRARAAAFELESDGDIRARCGELRLEVRDGVSIVSAGPIAIQGRRLDVLATHGSARIKANDDVQLLGENVLLNCERTLPAPMPAWALATPPEGQTVPVQALAGDVELAGEIERTRG